MHNLLVMAAIAVVLSGSAMAQHATEHEGGSNSVLTIPEDKRGSPVAVMAGAHLEITLDDQMRIATMGGGALPEADFDPSNLSRTEETLVHAGTVGMWAEPGSIGYSLLLAEDQTNLKVSNNTDAPIAYVLALYRGDIQDRDYEFTTTCTVPPGTVTLESWPYLVDGAVIFRVMTPPPSEKLLCVDPTKSITNPDWYPLEYQ